MKKIIPYILSAVLITGFSFLTTGKLFSQVDQKENKTNTARSEERRVGKECRL